MVLNAYLRILSPVGQEHHSICTPTPISHWLRAALGDGNSSVLATHQVHGGVALVARETLTQV